MASPHDPEQAGSGARSESQSDDVGGSRSDPANESGEKMPRIKRGRFDSLNLYEITDDELRSLEEGSPSSLHLNFAIALLSTAASFVATLATAEVKSELAMFVFVAIIVVGFAMGGFLMLHWWRTRRSISEIVARIKRRLDG